MKKLFLAYNQWIFTYKYIILEIKYKYLIFKMFLWYSFPNYLSGVFVCTLLLYALFFFKVKYEDFYHDIWVQFTL